MVEKILRTLVVKLKSKLKNEKYDRKIFVSVRAHMYLRFNFV